MWYKLPAQQTKLSTCQGASLTTENVDTQNHMFFLSPTAMENASLLTTIFLEYQQTDISCDTWPTVLQSYFRFLLSTTKGEITASIIMVLIVLHILHICTIQTQRAYQLLIQKVITHQPMQATATSHKLVSVVRPSLKPRPNRTGSAVEVVITACTVSWRSKLHQLSERSSIPLIVPDSSV